MDLQTPLDLDPEISIYIIALSGGQGESAGPSRGSHVTERWHWWPEEGSSFSPGGKMRIVASLHPRPSVRGE